MTLELYCLVILTIFFFLAWLPASIAKRVTYGRSYLLSNRDATDLAPMPAWGDRANRAYENLKSYFPAFVVSILVLAHLQISTASTQIAAIVFTLCRFAHFISYARGNVAIRAWSWGIALISNLYLLVTCLLN